MSALRELFFILLFKAEYEAFARYRMACGLVYRWNGQLPNSSETAEWIRQVGDGVRGPDIREFRDTPRPLIYKGVPRVHYSGAR